jgi:hypothetical protein
MKTNKSNELELKEFVEQTLAQIAQGVEAGQVRIAGEDERPSFKHSSETQKSTDVTFDLTVHASKTEGSKGQLGIFVGEALGVGVKGSESERNAITNRIQFTVPMKVYTVRSPEKYQ